MFLTLPPRGKSPDLRQRVPRAHARKPTPRPTASPPRSALPRQGAERRGAGCLPSRSQSRRQRAPRANHTGLILSAHYFTRILGWVTECLIHRTLSNLVLAALPSSLLPRPLLLCKDLFERQSNIDLPSTASLTKYWTWPGWLQEPGTPSPGLPLVVA